MKTTASVKTTKAAEGLSVKAKAREFEITCDEPVESGGTNTGMNPVEALLSALGSCMTIAAFYLAPSQGIELEYFGVDLEGDIDPDGFMGTNPDARPGFQEIRLVPHIKCNASDEEAKKFVHFVESRCPVHDCLATPVPMKITDIVLQ